MSDDALGAAALMAEVAAEAAAAPVAAPFPLLALAAEAPALREASVVVASPPLIGRTAYERLWAVINRLLRRAASPAIAPAVAQQNEWNAAVLDAVGELAALAAALEAESDSSPGAAAR